MSGSPSRQLTPAEALLADRERLALAALFSGASGGQEWPPRSGRLVATPSQLRSFCTIAEGLGVPCREAAQSAAGTFVLACPWHDVVPVDASNPASCAACRREGRYYQ